MQNRNQRPRRVPIQMAGSTFIRGYRKAPQELPAVAEVVTISPETRQIDIRASLDAREKSFKIERLATSLLYPDTPWCLHGKKLTKAEWAFECAYKRKYHTPKEPPISFECIKCFPVCVHGLSLSETEIDSGKRFSTRCPKCSGKIGSASNLEDYLKAQKLTEAWGWSPIESEFTTSYGLRITKSGKRLCHLGGSKEIEQTDASNVETIDDGNGVVAVHVGSGPSENGRGPDDGFDDSGWNVDDSGDPVSFSPSDTIKSFESIRKESTKEIFELSRHKVEKRDGYWALITDGTEVNRFATKKDASRAFTELTELDRLTFKNESSKRATKPEHQKQDAVATESEETTLHNQVVGQNSAHTSAA